MRPTVRTSRRLHGPTLLLAVCILVPAGYGFLRKFYELCILAGNDEGAFTILPIVNYLLASLGFAMLFFWAMLHGMFRDIERPKETMLANEAKLDAEAEDDRDAWKGW